MQTIESMPALDVRVPVRWQRIIIDSFLACVSVLVITGFIRIFGLYPRIPNISIIYLLPILALASIFGRYSALLASLVASLSFDFFIVPPLYTFTMNRSEEWIALAIFLVVALLISQLTLVMRESIKKAQQREREARILYELIRLTNMQEHSEEKLELVLLAFQRVFAAWGIHACALLLPDSQRQLTFMIDSSADNEEFALTDKERLLATQAMTQGEMQEQRYAPEPDKQDSLNRITHYTSMGPVTILRMFPLKIDKDVFGVICMRIINPAPWFASIADIQEKGARSDPALTFFWTFLEQATSILERARLRLEVLSDGPLGK